MSGQGEATDNVRAEFTEPAHNYLELQLVAEGKREFRCPFIEAEIPLAQAAPGAAVSAWVARLQGDEVEFVETQSGERRRLSVDQSLELGSLRVWLVDSRRPPFASLEAVSEPYTGRVWHLKSQNTWLGRQGKRFNHVELDHPTISRTHATFLPDGPGQVSLLCESASATTVNGDPLQPGQKRRLRNGDLLGFGQLLFRLAIVGDSGAEGSLLSMKTLGTFEVSLGRELGLGPKIKNQKAQMLLALLGLSWGKLQSVEHFLVSFWPEANARRGRKNLSHTVVQLREGLGLEKEDFEGLVIRSTASLQLNPDRLGSHDFVEVEKLTAGRRPITSQAALERLIGLYAGPFLPGCYEDWAVQQRARLELDLVETLLATAYESLEQPPSRLWQRCGEKLLNLDPQNQEATEILMRGYLQHQEPERARAAYQELVSALQGEEPDPELAELAKSC